MRSTAAAPLSSLPSCMAPVRAAALAVPDVELNKIEAGVRELGYGEAVLAQVE
ncbi:MAG: hypothetical protein V4673_02610 [Pseudomonadota bacterium]